MRGWIGSRLSTGYPGLPEWVERLMSINKEAAASGVCARMPDLALLLGLDLRGLLVGLDLLVQLRPHAELQPLG